MSHLAKYFENLTEPDFDRTSQLFVFCSFFIFFINIFGFYHGRLSAHLLKASYHHSPPRLRKNRQVAGDYFFRQNLFLINRYFETKKSIVLSEGVIHALH